MPGLLLVAMEAGGGRGGGCDVINCIVFLNVRVNAVADFARLWGAPSGAPLMGFCGFPSHERWLWVLLCCWVGT